VNIIHVEAKTMIDIRHLRTLQALRDTGSLGDAALRLHLTQSALSHQLRDLEDWLGMEVVVRKTRPPRFTPAGERLLRLAGELLPALAEAERDLVRLRGGQAGRLTLAIECHSCFEWLMPTLAAFRDHWPEVELDFQSGFHGDAQQQLLDRELDLVVTSNPGKLPGISYLPLFRYESVLIVGRQHALAAATHAEPADLAQETLVTYPVDPERLDVFQHFLTPASVRPNAIRTTELTLMMVQLVASGRGVAALPNWAAAEYLRRDWIKTLPLGPDGVWCTLYAAVRREDEALVYLQDFLGSARDNCMLTLEGIRPA
jgi:LysR family transcriptional regulator for metE and metH